ncbi:MAG: acyltransferase [Caldimonas sp.]
MGMGHPDMKASTERLPANNFDFLRFFFASLVVLSHSVPLSTGNESTEPLALITQGQITFGTLAVNCFFIISGFLILHSWVADPSTSQFLKKRCLRIYPAFLIVALLDAFLIAPGFSQNGYQGVDGRFTIDFALNALRLDAKVAAPSFQSNPASGTVNGSLWSISYEFWCYIGVLALGLAGLALKRRLVAAMLIVCIVLGFVFEWRHLTPSGWIFGRVFGYPPFWARLLPYFLAGMVFYVFRDRIRYSLGGALIATASLAVACWIPHGLTIVLPIAGAYLIFWFAFLSIPRLRSFTRYGDFSYGIYLYSFPLLQIVAYWSVQANGKALSPWSLFLVAWPLSIGCAAISWHLLEKHCIGWAKKKRAADPTVEQSRRVLPAQR